MEHDYELELLELGFRAALWIESENDILESIYEHWQDLKCLNELSWRRNYGP